MKKLIILLILSVVSFGNVEAYNQTITPRKSTDVNWGDYLTINRIEYQSYTIGITGVNSVDYQTEYTRYDVTIMGTEFKDVIGPVKILLILLWIAENVIIAYCVFFVLILINNLLMGNY